MPLLVISHPSHEEQRVELKDAEYVLGRDPNVAIPLRDRKVSRKHARVFRRGNDFYIEDLGSVNGVLLGGQTLAGARKMSPGVEYDVGGFILKLVTEETQQALTFSLMGRTDPVRDQVFMLPLGELEVGRVDGNAIVIPDASVSRTHAVLLVEPQQVIVEDKSSSNGTFVNDTRVGRRALAPGDDVRFGNVEFRFARADGFSSDRLRHVWSMLARADATTKVAAGIGALSVGLLVAIVVVLVARGGAAGASTSSPAEAAYERSVQEGLLRGRDSLRLGAWEESKRSFQAVLEADPINAGARDGLKAAQLGVQHGGALEQARTALNSNQPMRALELADSIPARSFHGEQAQEVGNTARLVLANEWFNRAQGNCRERRWLDCHKSVIEHLKYKPGSTTGRALLKEVEATMQSQRIGFTAWKEPGTPEELALQSRYPDDKVREAALRYMGGDVAKAIELARDLRAREAGMRLLAALGELQRTQDAADSAARAGDMPRAIRLWEQALSVDATILPVSQPSTTRPNLERRLARALFDLGEAAFLANAQQDAFIYWSKGLSYAPNDEQLARGVLKLEALGNQILDSTTGRSPEACARLNSVMTITRAESTPFLMAKQRAAACNR